LASKHAKNSTSMVEVAITNCFALFHDTTPLAKRKIYPNVDFLESTHPTKFESE